MTGHPRPVFVYQVQAEGTLDQVVQARVEGKADVGYQVGGGLAGAGVGRSLSDGSIEKGQ